VASGSASCSANCAPVRQRGRRLLFHLRNRSQFCPDPHHRHIPRGRNAALSGRSVVPLSANLPSAGAPGSGRIRTCSARLGDRPTDLHVGSRRSGIHRPRLAQHSSYLITAVFALAPSAFRTVSPTASVFDQASIQWNNHHNRGGKSHGLHFQASTSLAGTAFRAASVSERAET
jgi:hypothetical protein